MDRKPWPPLAPDPVDGESLSRQLFHLFMSFKADADVTDATFRSVIRGTYNELCERISREGRFNQIAARWEGRNPLMLNVLINPAMLLRERAAAEALYVDYYQGLFFGPSESERGGVGELEDREASKEAVDQLQRDFDAHYRLPLEERPFWSLNDIESLLSFDAMLPTPGVPVAITRAANGSPTILSYDLQENRLVDVQQTLYGVLDASTITLARRLGVAAAPEVVRGKLALYAQRVSGAGVTYLQMTVGRDRNWLGKVFWAFPRSQDAAVTLLSERSLWVDVRALSFEIVNSLVTAHVLVRLPRVVDMIQAVNMGLADLAGKIEPYRREMTLIGLGPTGSRRIRAAKAAGALQLFAGTIRASGTPTRLFQHLTSCGACLAEANEPLAHLVLRDDDRGCPSLAAAVEEDVRAAIYDIHTTPELQKRASILLLRAESPRYRLSAQEPHIAELPRDRPVLGDDNLFHRAIVHHLATPNVVGWRATLAPEEAAGGAWHWLTTQFVEKSGHLLMAPTFAPVVESDGAAADAEVKSIDAADVHAHSVRFAVLFGRYFFADFWLAVGSFDGTVWTYRGATPGHPPQAWDVMRRALGTRSGVIYAWRGTI